MYSEEIIGYNGKFVIFSAEVKPYAFFCISSDAIEYGTLSLLKDGNILASVDLSKNPNLCFTTLFDPAGKYYLQYYGATSIKDKYLNITYKDARAQVCPVNVM